MIEWIRSDFEVSIVHCSIKNNKIFICLTLNKNYFLFKTKIGEGVLNYIPFFLSALLYGEHGYNLTMLGVTAASSFFTGWSSYTHAQ